MAITTEMRAEVLELYTAYFNRAADKAGVDYWTNEMDTNGWTIDQVAQSFAEQTEFTTAYAGLTNEEIVDAVYTNVLNRAADADGKTYWVDELTAGTMKVQNLIQAVVAAAKEDKDGLGDADVLANKVAVSEYAYAQNLDEEAAKDISLDAITKDASTVDSLKSTIDTTVAATIATNTEALQLTTASDLITGTDGDDIINALVGTNKANGNLMDTAQSVDIIDGGAGVDTLNISTQAGGTFGATITNVENINYTAYTGQTYDMSNTSGVETLTNISSIGALTVTNASAMDLSIKNVNNQDTSVSFDTSDYTATTDEITLTLSNINNTTVGKETTLTGNTIETVNIVSSGSANNIDLGGTALAGTTKVVVTGDQDLNFNDTDGTANAMAAIKTFDASALTGALTADLTSVTASTNVTITSGSGDDKVTMDDFTKDDSVDLGAGSDKLTISIADATTNTKAASLANIETIAFLLDTDKDNADEDNALNLSGATSLTTIEVGKATHATSVLTLNKLASSVTTLNLNGNGVTVDQDINDVVFKLETTTGTSDSLTVNVTNKDTNGNLINSTKGIQLDTDFTANGIESITINTDKLHPDTDANTQDGGLAMTLSADKVSTLTISSETLINLSSGTLDDSIRTVDASGANGGILIDADTAADADNGTTADKALSITTGDGVDTITNFLGSVVTTITTGAGNDTISSKAATDYTKTVTIDAGAGNDSIDLSADTGIDATGAILKKITLGDGVDTIKIASGATAATTQNGIIISDFTAGSGGDKIDLSTTAGITIGGTLTPTDYEEIDFAATADQKNTIGGLTVDTSNSLTALTSAAFVTAFGTTAHTAADVYWVVASDGTDAGLFQVADNVAINAAGSNAAASDTSITDKEVLLVATLTGISDASKLTVDNFTDFLA